MTNGGRREEREAPGLPDHGVTGDGVNLANLANFAKVLKLVNISRTGNGGIFA